MSSKKTRSSLVIEWLRADLSVLGRHVHRSCDEEDVVAAAHRRIEAALLRQIRSENGQPAETPQLLQATNLGRILCTNKTNGHTLGRPCRMLWSP